MRVLTCIFTEHNLWLVLLAACLCVAGSTATVRLWQRLMISAGRSRFDWAFLTGVTAGASIWATHFVAMLGYEPGVPTTFDPQLTIISAVVAMVGTTWGFWLSTTSKRTRHPVLGGATIGLSIAAMHFVGMFAYRADGIVAWDATYIGASIILAVAFSISAALALTIDRSWIVNMRTLTATGLLVVAIVSLHFTGMAAFSVTPLAGVPHDANSGAFGAMAMAVAAAALLIIMTGVCTRLIDDRSRLHSQEELIYIATHDELTGLANRRHLTEELRRAFSRENDKSFGLMMIDLDRFKPVNDTLGHQVGDLVLQRVARRLQQTLSEGDVLARFGGDEFAVLVTDCDGDAGLGCRGARVVEMLARPIIVEGHLIELGASVGIAIAHRDGATPGELTQNADIALYAAKAAGRSTFCLYQASMSQEIQIRRSLEGDLRRAVNREEFEVYYQPQVDAKTGAYTGAEALLRWRHPERGLLSPALFVPLAEEIGLIGAIGTRVLQRACHDATLWPPHLTVAVNLSAVQLLDRRLARIVRNVLAESGLPPHRLELEITETSLIGNDLQALSILNEIRALGVTISLDDFGTGYSSLSYLHRFPIDKIKIDRSFIERAPEDEDSGSIIRAITQLGASLGMKVTAEGIETEAQWAFSSDGGCDHLQGYLISKPVPVSQLNALFENLAAARVSA